MTHFNWTPGIGDPTIAGWVTVVLYFLAMISCWKTARSLSGDQERRIWKSISVSFLALGINKQLDLQTALTEVGRLLANTQGWYGQRQYVQLDFIIIVASVCAIAILILVIWARRALLPTWVSILGAILVIGFVLIRAASFHHIDRFIGNTVLGFRWNWILEMGGIGVVIFGSQWRQRSSKFSPTLVH